MFRVWLKFVSYIVRHVDDIVQLVAAAAGKKRLALFQHTQHAKLVAADLQCSIYWRSVGKEIFCHRRADDTDLLVRIILELVEIAAFGNNLRASALVIRQRALQLHGGGSLPVRRDVDLLSEE